MPLILGYDFDTGEFILRRFRPDHETGRRFLPHEAGEALAEALLAHFDRVRHRLAERARTVRFEQFIEDLDPGELRGLDIPLDL